MQKVLTVLAGGALAVVLSAPPAFAAPPAGRSEESRQSARVERHDRHGDDGDDWDDDGGWSRRRDHDGGCCRCRHGVLSRVLDYLL